MKVRSALAALWLAYAVFWIGGVGGHLLYGGTPANMRWTAPLFLALASLLVVVSNPADWPACAISFAAGFLAEAIGASTGYPFGRSIPVWAGALAMTLFDLVIDPLAANTLGYWKWTSAGPYFGVPLSNFAGWFCVSFLILTILRARPARSVGVVLTGCSILIFFALVSIAHHYFVPAGIGVTLCALPWWRRLQR